MPRRESNRAPQLLPVGILAVAIFWGIHQLQPPAAVPADADPARFSSGRAIRHLPHVAAVPHPLGTDAHAEVRDYLLDRLTDLGLAPHVQEAQVVRARGLHAIRAATVRNVVGRIRGTGSSVRAVLLVSHYDSRPHTPGAADDGYGVVAMLETLRALRHHPPLANDVIYLISDGEELGLLGARAFAEQHPWFEDVALVLNFEASGTTGHSLMFETGPNNRNVIAVFADAAPHPSATSLSYEVYRRMPNDTDFSVFKNRGLPGLNFACIGNRFDYHTMGDNLGNVDERVIQHHGSSALALTLRFGDEDLTGTTEGNAVYFNTVGFGFTHYAERWILPLNLLALAGLVALLVVGWRAGRLRALPLLGGLLAMLLHVVLPVVVAASMVGGLLRLFEGADAWLLVYNQQLLLASFACMTLSLVALLHVGCVRRVPPAVSAALFVALIGLLWLGELLSWPSVAGALFVSALTYLLLRRPIGPADLTAGILIGWTILALLVGFAIPGASYLFTWPLLLGLASAGLSFLRGSDTPPTLLDGVETAVLAIPAVLWYTGLAVLFHAAMGLKLTGVAIALVALALTLLIPQIESLTAARSWPLPAGAAAASLLLLLVATVGARFDARHARPSSAWYALDADSGEAFWQSAEAEPDAWSTSFVGRTPSRSEISRFLPSSPGEVLGRPAPTVELAAPQVTLVEQSTDGDGRRLRLRVASTRRAPVVNVFFPSDSPIAEARIDDRLVELPVGPGPKREGWWRWRYYGPADDGFELELKLDDAEPLMLRVTDYSYELPPLEGLPDRPWGSMPTPYTLSDMTVVTRSFSF